jgi:hypothetical protein
MAACGNGNRISTRTLLSPVGPEKGRLFSCFAPFPTPLSVTCVKALLVRILFPTFLLWLAPFPVILRQTLYKPSTYQLRYFSHDNGGGMFLRNVDTDLQNHTAPKSKKAPISSIILSSISFLPSKGLFSQQKSVRRPFLRYPRYRCPPPPPRHTAVN